ncbi:MAG: exodeoxyribonuclease VII small subunit [Clostridia bacterium]|jgi:exodeoxyribonuclease VII small subunit|nr:exodeoxyribonuclease VII small subunit [Clostridia bacterium]MBT7123284.1 exodeoxyribonuclease VII small subunit [Clostridia bacterium]
MATFESDLKKLEQISGKLQSGSEGIEKSMELYEQGVKLADELEKKLDTYKSKIEILDIEESEK